MNTTDQTVSSFVPEKPEAAFVFVGVKPLTCAVGEALALELLSDENAVTTHTRFHDVRREIAREKGVILPEIDIRVDAALAGECYRIYVQGKSLANGSIHFGKILALGNTAVLTQLEGIECREPVYGLAGKWIEAEGLKHAREIGAMVFDPLSVIASHFGRVCREQLHDILRYQDFIDLTKHLEKKMPNLMSSVGQVLSTHLCYLTFKQLLREQVNLRDHAIIFEALLYAGETTQDPALLAESVRKSIIPVEWRARQSKSITFCTIEPSVTDAVLAVIKEKGSLKDSDIGMHLHKELVAFVGKRQSYPFVICSADIRRHLAAFVLDAEITVLVFSRDEIPKEIKTTECASIGWSL